MRRVRYSIVAAVFSLMFAVPSITFSVEAGKGFATPEEAVRAYVGHIGKGDFLAALECFCYREKSKNIHFPAFVRRVKSIAPDSMGPSEYEAYDELNQAKNRADAAMQIRFFTYSLLLPEKFAKLLEMKIHVFKNMTDENIDADTREFVEALNPNRLEGLKLVMMGLANPRMQESPGYKKTATQRGAVYGYVEEQEYVALYELNGDSYIGGLTLVKYGDDWFIDKLHCNLVVTAVSGVVSRGTVDKYRDMTLP